MAAISFSTPTADNGQAANTLFVEGTGLPVVAPVVLSITATGSSGMSVSGQTDSAGNIQATIPITDPVIQALLPMIGNGSISDGGFSWATSASDGVNTITVTCSVN